MKLFEMIRSNKAEPLSPEAMRQETNALLVKHSSASALGQIVLMLIAVILTGHNVPTWQWLSFSSFVVVFNISRWMLIKDRLLHSQEKPFQWYVAYSAATLLSATTWSAFTCFIFVKNGLASLASTEMLILMAGIGSAAAAGLGCDRKLARAFVTIILASLLVSQAFSPSDYSHALTAIMGVYLAFLWVQIEAQRNSIWEMWGQREQIRAFANASMEGVVIHAEGRIIEANPMFHEIFQVRGDVRGLSVFDFAPPAEHEFLARRMHQNTDASFETLGVRRDGQVFPMELRGRWFMYKGQPARITCIFDITDRKKAEVAMKMGIIQDKNLAEARERSAVESSQLKSQFLASMSHEIRTPLNAIIGITDILGEMDTTPAQARYISTLKDSGESLLGLINDILDYSKIEADKIELEITDVSLLSIVEAQAQLLSSRVYNKGLDLQVYVDPQIPMDVRGDGGRIGQILLNLLGNALKFTARGGIGVRCFPLAWNGDKLNVRFEVADSGIGIADAAAAKLFTPFTQADISITRKHGGTGLGLSICKKLVEMMEGRIGFDSRPGIGTTFWFELPLEVPHRRALADNYSLAEWRDLRPVVIEDNLESRSIICDYLKAWDLAPRVVSMADFLETESAHPENEIIFVSGLNSVPLLSASGRRSHLRTVIIQEKGSVVTTPKDMIPALKGTVTLSCPVKQSDLFNVVVSAVKTEAAGFFNDSKRKKNLFKKARLLIAEDNSVNQTVILALLKQLGLQGRAVSNGQEAIQALAESQFDLVLMDCQMPEMDGFEATMRIRQIEKSQLKAQIPIVALTANVFKEDRDRCLESGMNDFLSKPIRKDRLIETLKKYLALEDEDDSMATEAS